MDQFITSRKRGLIDSIYVLNNSNVVFLILYEPLFMSLILVKKLHHDCILMFVLLYFLFMIFVLFY
jgi:hypothetical protein